MHCSRKTFPKLKETAQRAKVISRGGESQENGVTQKGGSAHTHTEKGGKKKRTLEKDLKTRTGEQRGRGHFSGRRKEVAAERGHKYEQEGEKELGGGKNSLQ